MTLLEVVQTEAQPHVTFRAPCCTPCASQFAPVLPERIVSFPVDQTRTACTSSVLLFARAARSGGFKRTCRFRSSVLGARSGRHAATPSLAAYLGPTASAQRSHNRARCARF